MIIINQLILIGLSFIILFVSGSEIVVQKDQAIIPTSAPTENEQLLAFSHLMNFIDIICQEALKKENPEDMKTFALNWMGALQGLVQEIYTENSYTEMTAGFDSETLGNDFDKESLFQPTLNTFRSNSQILLSEDSMSETSESEQADEVLPSILDAIVKSKMEKGSVDEEIVASRYFEQEHYEIYEDDFEAEEPEHKKGGFDEKDEKENDISDAEADEKVQVRYLVEPKRKGGRRGGNGRGAFGGINTGNLLNSNNLNMAAGLLMTSDGSEMKIGAAAEIGIETGAGTSIEAGIGAGISVGNSQLQQQLIGMATSPNSFDQAAMMEQLQQQLMSQVMEQLAQNPQFAQFSSLLQDEHGKLTAALGTDANGLPNLSKEGAIQFLRTSALPKLLNSAIKGKTGIDVLKSLSMALRVLNEGLGVFEVVLGVLIKTTRKVRYYTLCISSIVADMAREDNMTPLVDLSVSVDALPEVVEQKSMMRRVGKMFRKSFKKTTSESVEEDTASISTSPLVLGMQAALSKARDYNSQFQKLPPKLLLTLIHTIVTELDKRNGLVRVALSRKQHKTLIGLQDSVNKAVETIYKAIIHQTPEAADHLVDVPASVFTDILLSLISSVRMEPMKLNSHLTKVTEWMKPLMVILDEDSQLSVLDFLLTDPEAEQMFAKSYSISKPAKKFNWSFHRKAKKCGDDISL